MRPSPGERGSSARGLVIGIFLQTDQKEPDPRAALEGCPHSVVFVRDRSDQAIDACREHQPDILLLCRRRPDGESVAFLAPVMAASPGTRSIMLCQRAGEREVRRALDAGARAIVPSERIDQALLPVIGAVWADQISVPLVAGGGASRSALTAREKQILGQVVLGMSNGEIASRLFLAESTVKSHLSSAFAKLGVSSRSEAAALILDPAAGVGLGILTIPSEKISSVR